MTANSFCGIIAVYEVALAKNVESTLVSLPFRVSPTSREILVSSRKKSLIVCVVILTLASVQAVKAREGIHTVKARVRFLATSWVIRGTWGHNEDKYLAEIALTPSDAPSLAYLIDNYRNEEPPLSFDVLTAQKGTVLRLRQDSVCNIPIEQIAFRTAPGDPMAILPGRLGYHPVITQLTKTGTVIPCYRIARK